MVKHLKAFFLELGHQFPWGSIAPFQGIFKEGQEN